MDGILGADAREDAVHQPNFGCIRRHKAANLSHQHNQHHLAQKGGFAAHVGSSNHADDLTLFKN